MEGTHQAIGLRGVHQPALLERLAEGCARGVHQPALLGRLAEGRARGVPSEAAELALRARTVLASPGTPRTHPGTVGASRRKSRTRWGRSRYSAKCLFWSPACSPHLPAERKRRILSHAKGRPATAAVAGDVWGIPGAGEDCPSEASSAVCRRNAPRVPGGLRAQRERDTEARNRGLSPISSSLAVINLRRDLHPQECAHAGRTRKKREPKLPFLLSNLSR